MFHATNYKTQLPDDLLSTLNKVNGGKPLKGANVQSLNLRGNDLDKLTPEAWTALGTVLKGANIQSLDLSLNGLGKLTPEAWTAFGEMLKGANVQSLDLSWNGSSLDDQKRQGIIKILQRNKTYTSLGDGAAFCIWHTNGPNVIEELEENEYPSRIINVIEKQGRSCEF